tara:strand:+ start:5093 stop:6973 length:1881 start_codon:yes stop_codon:yes gene_type:complete
MANAGDLYLGDMSGFRNQLDLRHNIIEKDKQDQIDVANQIRNDITTLGRTAGDVIREVGAPEWLGGRKSKPEDEQYAGYAGGMGQNAANYEQMRYNINDKERNFKISHNQQIINAGMMNIKMAKEYDLNQRWYGADPVALEKSHSKQVSDIMQAMDAYHPYEKIERAPHLYSDADRKAIKLIRENQAYSPEERDKKLQAYKATPMAFTKWAETRGLVNTEFVKTYPQATIQLRNRLVDMGYLDGNIFLDNQKQQFANKKTETDAKDNSGVDVSTIKENRKASQSSDSSNTISTKDDDSNKGVQIGRTVYGGKNNNKKTDDRKENVRYELQGRTLKRIVDPPDPYKGASAKKETSFTDEAFQFLKNNLRPSWRTAYAATPDNLNTDRINNFIKYEGAYKTDGRLYNDGGGLSLPGGANLSWAYGKSEGDKKTFANLAALDDSGKVNETLAKDILELLNTQGSTPQASRSLQLKKYGKGSDAWKDIKLSSRGMKSVMDYMSNHNISELVRTNSYLKDPNAKGGKLNQKLPQEFRDLLADITYRFGGSAFTNSKSLWTPNKKRLPFEKVLKDIVTAKKPSDRIMALQAFQELFKQTKIYRDEKNTQRIKDTIGSIDKLMNISGREGSWK